jgi:hypothetical protein
MKDVYTRLRALGFDRPYVQRFLLPDWWQDTMAAVPANRALAEISIAQVLGIPLPELRDPSRTLRLEAPVGVRFKRPADTAASELDAAIALAQRAASGLVGCVRSLPDFAGPVSASELRTRVMSRAGDVDLDALVQAAWDHGVAVIPLPHLPPKARRFTAAALLCGARRVVVLASRRDAPPWLAHDLAHELGHVFLGHVSEASPVVVETQPEEPVSEQEDHEAAANRFALELLTGYPAIEIGRVEGVDKKRLAKIDARFRGEWRTAPGVVALLWGYRAGRMGVANGALQLLHQDTGGAAIVRDHFIKRIAEPDDLSETNARYLDLATGE